MRDYFAHEEALYAKCSFHRKATYSGLTNTLKGESVELLFTTTNTLISSATAQRCVGVATRAGGSPETQCSLSVGGEVYNLGRGDSPKGYAVAGHRAVHDRAGAHPAFYGSLPTGYPLAYLDSTTNMTFGYVLREQSNLMNADLKPRLQSVQLTQLDGQPALAAKFRCLYGIGSTLYLDPANDYAYLGFDSDGSPDHKARKKSPVAMSGRVTYRASAEGIPVPAKLEVWYILPGGKRLLQRRDEVTTFEKYTPTADDFDLEKQFGVKPLPLPGTAATTSGGRSWRWLYAGAAVLGLVTIALAVVARRRRRAEA